ncbi:MAG: TonB-dependent receptor domain-containing protein [Chitinophagaceae bacterium]
MTKGSCLVLSFVLFFTLGITLPTFAQKNISLTGIIQNKITGEKLSGVTIVQVGTTQGAISDDRGFFKISTSAKLPITLSISSLGYQSSRITITSLKTPLLISLIPSELLGQEVVVAASRVPENILQSPVSIERLGSREIKTNPAPSYYDAIANLKGVSVVTSSLTFQSYTTRGFGGSGNVRMNQMVDGMDNQAPGLNFPVGNIIGPSDLDVDHVELLPGASSALYGSGGTNGTLLIVTKDPFQYQGLSVLVKEGIMHVSDPQHGATPYQDYSLRYAKAVNTHFAFKFNVSYLKAYDWIASDSTDYDKAHFTPIPGTRVSDPNYDGVNVYGDETNANIQTVAQGMAAAGAIPVAALSLVPNQNVSRTGYPEQDLVDYHTHNLKFNGELEYHITSQVKAIAEGNWGTGTTVYTGSDRYSLKNFKIGQYKLELDGKNFMVRGYTTQENAGEAYNATVLGQLINEAWKPSYNPNNQAGSWYPQFVGAFIAAKEAGGNNGQAYAAARNYADQGMPTPGSPAFQSLFNQVRSLPIPAGALFMDKTSLYQYEGLYNFSSLTQLFDLQVGADFRRFHLNSNGTIFDDANRTILIDEYGTFAQAAKKFLDDKLKLSAAIRYDKNQNFQGKWTPRFTAVYQIAKENNIRISYQTGYRLPTTQNQYIDLNVGRARIVGGLPEFQSKYNMVNNPVFTSDNAAAYGMAFQQYYQQYAQTEPAQIAQYNAAVAAEKVLVPYTFNAFQPESVKSFEVGYKGILDKKLLVDAYTYFSNYEHFIGSIFLLQDKNGPQQISPLDPKKYYGPGLASDATRNIYETSVNSTGIIKTWGWALGLEYLLPKKYVLSGNVSYNKLNNAPQGFFTQFNTPDYQAYLSLSKEDFFQGIGFDIAYRYQDAFLYQGTFAVGNVPTVNTLDAQLSYLIAKWKATLKIGGTNILNHYYQNAYGNPMIGGLYYISIGYNL